MDRSSCGSLRSVDPRPGLRRLRRNFEGSAEAGLLRRGRDRRAPYRRCFACGLVQVMSPGTCVLFDPSHIACGESAAVRLHEIRQRPVSSWSPGAHGRGRPWHPLGSDPRSLCARLEVFRASCQIGRAVRNGNADLEDRWPSSGAPPGSRVFFYVCLINSFFAWSQLCMTRLRLSTALGRPKRPPSMRSSVG